MLFGIDSGGTRTVVAVEERSGVRTRVFPSANPASVGDEVAERNLGLAIRWIAERGDAGTHFGWVGSAEVSAFTLSRAERRLKGELRTFGLRAVVVMTNDAYIPLLAPPLNGVGIAVIVGTGSVAIGCDATGPPVQCGGYEYLISDEGGGYDIGVRGLRAAACAYDGRKRDTLLLEMARREYDSDIPAIGRELALSPFPKQSVASFGRHVCRAAAEGDEAAIDILETAARGLFANIEGVLNKLRGPIEYVAVCGSIPANSAEYLRMLRRNLEAARPGLALLVAPDGSLLALRLAERLMGSNDMPKSLEDVPHAFLQTGLP